MSRNRLLLLLSLPLATSYTLHAAAAPRPSALKLARPTKPTMSAVDDDGDDRLMASFRAAAESYFPAPDTTAEPLSTLPTPPTSPTESEDALSSPSPEDALSPLSIVEEQIAAMQQGPDDESLNRFWSFVDPGGGLAAKHATSAAEGPVARFRQMMRYSSHPRWKHIPKRPLAALLECRNVEIFKGSNRGFVDDQTFKVRVTARPYFPDVPDAESTVLYEWLLRRQVVGSVASPRAVWRVDDITPDWPGWVVYNE